MPHRHNGVGIAKLNHHQPETAQRYMRSNHAFESGRADKRRVFCFRSGLPAAQRERETAKGGGAK